MTEKKKLKLTKKERDYFRKVISDKREKLMQKLDYKREAYLSNSPGSEGSVDSNYAYHMADVGTDAAEREKMFMHFARENKFLSFLNDAMERIQNDPNFGYCAECGNRIPDARLEEVPHTTHCVECKSKIK